MSRKKIMIFFFFLLMSPLFSQNQGKLQVNIIPHSIQQRSFSPVPVTVQFHWKGLGFLSGRLEVGIYINDILNNIIISDDLVIAGSGLERKMFLPVNAGNSYIDSITLKMKFHIEDGNFIPLQSQTIPFSRNPGCFIFNICEISNSYLISKPDNTASELRIEKLAPLENLDNNLIKRNTITTLVPIERVPGTVFGYCPYDIVVLREAALREMDQGRLEILSRWVSGGGALLIRLNGSSLKGSHLGFLNNLIKDDSNSIFRNSVNSKLIFPEDFPSNRIGYYYYGLGRVVISDRKFKSDADFSSSDWRKLSAFLWRVRTGRLKNVINGKSWFSEKEIAEHKKRAEDRHYNYYYDDHNHYDSLSRISTDFIYCLQNNIESFLPPKFTMVPIWVLALILLCFILIIGPGEYFILGKFGLRKYTWITFPLTCVAFAFFTIYIAEYYMGIDDHISSITFIDEDDEGKVLRKIAYNVVFTGTTKSISRKFGKEIYSDSGTFMSRRYYNPRYYRRYNNNLQFQPAVIEGRCFTDYSVSCKYKQWEPKINRLVSFEAKQQDSHSWKFPEKCTMKKAEELSAKLQKSLPVSEKTVNVAVVKRKNVKLAHRYSDIPIFKKIAKFISGKTEPDSERINIFSIVSFLSPAVGLAGSEILITDPDDPNVSLLIVGIFDNRKRNLKIYRRVYREKRDKLISKNM